MSYQGYENRGTWCVCLWLDNEQGTYECAQHLACEAWERSSQDPIDKRSLLAARDAGETIRDWIEEHSPLADDGGSFYSEMLASAMRCINWDEVGNHYLRDNVAGYQTPTFSHEREEVSA